MSFGESGTVLGFSFTGGSLPAGSGTLVSLSFVESALSGTISASDVIIAGADGNELVVTGPADADIPLCNDNDGDLVCNDADPWPDCSDDGTDPYDDCGDCNGGNAAQDCNGDCYGSATDDNCGVCSGGNSGHTADSDIDCNGDCFGSAADDSCGVCSGGNSGHDADSDQDCNGDCFGSAADDSCGVCSGGNSGHDADSDQDCAGR